MILPMMALAVVAQSEFNSVGALWRLWWNMFVAP